MDETPSRLVPSSPTAKDRASSPPASKDARIPSFETMDRLGRAVTARLTQGISPHALYAAWFDWASHLVNAPGRLIELGVEAVNIGARLARFTAHNLSEAAKEDFIRTVANTLAADLKDEKFDELVLVAPPGVIAELKCSLSKPTAKVVAKELHKDLTKVPDHELTGHLAQ